MTIPAEIAEAIVQAGRRLDRFGWVPATAGNFSMRLAGGRVAVTASGRHKGFLAAEDVMAVCLDGTPEEPGRRSSAETLLHCGIYRRFAEAGAVLHGHSIANTVLSRAAGATIRLAGYELLKAFPGLPTHDAAVELPVVDNDQDIARMQRGLDALWDGIAPEARGGMVALEARGGMVAPEARGGMVAPEARGGMVAPEARGTIAPPEARGTIAPPEARGNMTAIPPGYLIRGHGAYVWAPDMPTALLRLEALEFMLSCELEERKLAR